MTANFSAFDRAIKQTTEPFINLADNTITGLDAIEQRNQTRKAQIEKERKATAAQIKKALGNA